MVGVCYLLAMFLMTATTSRGGGGGVVPAQAFTINTALSTTATRRTLCKGVEQQQRQGAQGSGISVRLPSVSLSLSSSSSSGSTSEQQQQQQPMNNNVSLKRKEKQTLGLLTFDLDDTLYPIAPVIADANAAFARAMEQYGYPGVAPMDIVETGKMIREEIGQTDPEKAAALTHTEVRELAIRRQMENTILQRKLQSCADDWATQVSDLTAVVVEHAKSWARNAVSESIVQAVLSAWEMERHHSAERNLYPEVVESLKEIKESHPTAIIGAVTDGRANPLLMTFTLAPYFDFCCAWEDDQGGRTKFFTELDRTAGESAQLAWIYDEARHKYAVLKQAKDGMSKPPDAGEDQIPSLVFPATYDDRAWIHVGDDLAFDVGGSKACGAKTIYAELADDKYGQTARHRFDLKNREGVQRAAGWVTSSRKELEKRLQMNDAARDKVDVTLKFMTRLPEAIDDILQAAGDE